MRDYVHVMDLAEAHVLGLRWLLDGRGNAVFNLGSGSGFSVREVIAAAEAVTEQAMPARAEARRASNRGVPVIEGERRAGDAASLVSGSVRAMRDLGWQPKRSNLTDMITDAWRWAQGPGYPE